VNGDGYADLMVGGEPKPSFEPERDVVWIYLGGSNGVATKPAVTLVASATYNHLDDEFGYDATALDVNGDGYWDIAVSDAETNKNYTSPFPQNENIFMGGPAGISATPTMVFPQLGLNGTGADVNGDGYEDLFQAYATPNGNPGTVFMLPGSSAGLQMKPWLTLSCPPGDRVFAGPMGAASGS
jgi:hypothetical protein